MLSHLDIIPKSRYWSPDDVTVGMQSFLITVEMFVASLWHMRDECFGYGDFKTAHTKGTTNILNSMRDAFDPTTTLKEWGHGFYHLFMRCMGKEKQRQFDDEAMMPLHS